MYKLDYIKLVERKGIKMKKMTKMIAATMAAMFCLAGCGDSGSVSGTASQADDSSKQVLRVGMDLKFPPFSYLDDNNMPAGLEPDISAAFAEFMGMELEIVDTDFSLLIPALETGAVDILIADMSYTDERAQKADFSDSYRYTNTLALVNKDFAEANNITDDMPEEEFFAITGANFVGLSGTKGVYYPQSYGIDVTEVTEIGSGLLEVSTGMADVLVASNEVHSFHAADPDNTIVYSGIKEQSGSNFVAKKGNSEMIAKANEFIATMYEDGGLYDQLAEKFDPIVGEFLHNDDLGLGFIVNPSN